MIAISERWEKGKLVSRKEIDDGTPNNHMLDLRLKIVEAKTVPVAVI